MGGPAGRDETSGRRARLSRVPAVSSTRVVLLVLALCVGALTLGPMPHVLFTGALQAFGALGPDPVVAPQALERLGNVALFAPVAALVLLAFPRLPLWAVWVTCLCGSVAVEAVQGLALTGRTSSAGDVALNSLGAAGGIGVVVIARRWLARRRGPKGRPPARDRILDRQAQRRGDVEALRALAVALVLAYHLTGWPGGGYVGVDVFFVVSGYVVTRSLLDEHASTGAVSIRRFYARRIRRLAPGGVTVIGATVVAACLLLPLSRAVDAVVDAVASLLLVANWWFARTETDYFRAEDAASPLQHFWSLAVEEQFYLAWPLLLLALLWVAAKTRRPSVVVLGTAALLVASLGWAFAETAARPTWAYFSTASRAWELGVGAVMALLPLGRWSHRWSLSADRRMAVAGAGMLLVVASAVLADTSTRTPAPWSLLPVAGAAFVITAGSWGRGRYSDASSLVASADGPTRYTAEASYALYLWHFPVVVLVAPLLPPWLPLPWVPLSLLTVLLAVGTVHLVERPVRRSTWLLRGRSRPAGFLWVASTAVAGLVCVAIALGLTLPRVQLNQPDPALDPPTLALESGGGAESPAPTEAELHELVEQASSATAWPALTPAIGELGRGAVVPEWRRDRCLNVSADDVSRCTYGTGSKTAVLLGDSVAISWMPGLRAALERRDWQITSLTLGECPAVFIPTTRADDPAAFTATCDAHHAWVLGEVQRLQPDLVVMTSGETSMARLASGNRGDQASAEWSSALEGTVERLEATADRVVVLGPPPRGASLQECSARAGASPARCTGAPGDLWTQLASTEERTVDAHRGSVPVDYVSPLEWFCADGACPPFAGRTPVFADGTHLTADYSRLLEGVLRDALDP